MAYNGRHLIRKKGRKKTVLAVTALIAAAAIGAGSFFISGSSRKTVNVYPFRSIGMTEFWGDAKESYGNVTADRVQTVFLSETQTVTALRVKEGEEVKKGQILLTYDTTLSELELERKRLEVEKKKIERDDEQRMLDDLLCMAPMKPPQKEEEKKPWYGRQIRYSEEYGKYMEIPMDERLVDLELKHDGSAEERAIICWLSMEEYYNKNHINMQVINAVRAKAALYREMWQSPSPPVPDYDLTPPEETEETENPTQETIEDWIPPGDGMETLPPSQTVPPQTTEETKPPQTTEETKPPQTTEETKPPQTTEETKPPQTTEETKPPQTTEETKPPQTTQETEPPAATQEIEQEPASNASAFPDTAAAKAYWYQKNESEEETTPKPDPAETVYVVFKVTEDDRVLAPCMVWQGLRLRFEDGGGNVSFTFFEPTMEDYSRFGEEDMTQTVPETYDPGGIYTAAQLTKMRKEQKIKVREAELALKMAEAEYKIMQREISDGAVRATFDGKVVSMLTEEEAKSEKKPVLKISGGGGFYIQGLISELDRDNIVIGQEVTINDYRSGEMLTGTIQRMQDLPGTQTWSGMGNPNTSYYPFVVFVKADADLQEESVVTMSFAPGGQMRGLYLENPFIRTENGETYVYVRGANGRLEKRSVEVGKALWSSYTEILSGLSEDEYLAFPYGKNVKSGVQTREGQLSELYGY